MPYSKEWCPGFCRTCGTACAEHSEEIFQLRAERDRLRELQPVIQPCELHVWIGTTDGHRCMVCRMERKMLDTR